MNIRVLAGAAAIAVTGVLAYGFYQLMPEGEPLARSEVIGELDGPPLAGYSRTRLYRYGEHQFLVGQLIAGDKDIAGLAKAPVLDALLPSAADCCQADGATRAEAASADPTQGMLQAAASARDVRNLVYGGRDNGRYALLGSIGGDTGVTLLGGPQGQAIYLVGGSQRRGHDGDASSGWDVWRSDDQGANWRYAPDLQLGAPRRFTVFLTDERAMALTDGSNGAGDERLLVSEDGAPLVGAVLARAGLARRRQLWPGVPGTPGPGRAATDQLVYGWSLYPLAADRAVGWSWRDRVTVGVARPSRPGVSRCGSRTARRPRSALPTTCRRCRRRIRARSRGWGSLNTPPTTTASTGSIRPTATGTSWPPCRPCAASAPGSGRPGSAATAGWCRPMPTTCSRSRITPAPTSTRATRAGPGGRSSSRPTRSAACSAWTRRASVLVHVDRGGKTIIVRYALE
ncbi:hypothetical protein WJ972_07695 [Achromobacter insuavis]